MRRSKRRLKHERGVSLIEVLVALAIFALGLSQVAASMGDDARSLGVSAADIAALIKTAGRNARLDGRMRTIHASGQNVTVSRDGVRESFHNLPSGRSVTVVRPIILFDHGGTSGGEIALKDETQVYAILISRFDGSVKIERRPGAIR